MTTDYFPASSKKPNGRGMAKKSIALTAAMHTIAAAAQPITGAASAINYSTRA